MINESWQSIVRFFRNESLPDNTSELSDPIAVRLPSHLLEEVNIQAKAIGGDRYRSKHLVNLIEIGTKFYRINSEFVASRPIAHINLITRLHYVFNELKLKVEKVAYTLEHKDAMKVSAWLSGAEVPSFDEIDKFCSVYFINPEWLKFGNTGTYDPELTPFIVIRKSFHYWKESLKEITEEFNGLKPSSIRLIRSENGTVLISVGYGKDGGSWLVRSFHYSNLKLKGLSDVGNSGFCYLVELALLCKILYKYIRDPSLIISYSISNEEMKLLENGEKIPVQLDIWGQTKANFWYESIFDKKDTNSNSDNIYWPGATELFNALQDSSNFIKGIKTIEEGGANMIAETLKKDVYNL